MATERNTFYVRKQGWSWYVFSTFGGCVSGAHDCPGFAQSDADERQAEWDAVESAEAAQQADYMATQRELDVIYREISRKYDADLPATEPRNFAVRQILDAIDSLGRPSAEDERRAA